MSGCRMPDPHARRTDYSTSPFCRVHKVSSYLCRPSHSLQQQHWSSRCTMIRQLLPSIRCIGTIGNALISSIAKRGFVATNPIWAKKMPDRPPPVNDDEFTESYLKGSGPGGQKIVGWPHYWQSICVLFLTRLLEPMSQVLCGSC
jgi:hypothetical protein